MDTILWTIGQKVGALGFYLQEYEFDTGSLEPLERLPFDDLDLIVLQPESVQFTQSFERVWRDMPQEIVAQVER